MGEGQKKNLRSKLIVLNLFSMLQILTLHTHTHKLNYSSVFNFMRRHEGIRKKYV